MMDLTKLTNQQLYAISQNGDLDKDIRKIANDEFNNRKLDIEQVKQVVSNHDLNFKHKNDPLKNKYKILLILFPFIIPIESAFAAKWLARGYKRKWKDYWFYLSMGYLFWTIIIIVFSRYFLFNRH